MATFKCKMCGGTIEFEPGSTVGICDSCGTKQTLPHLDDDRRANLYDRANHFRRNNEFDKAAGIYEQILNEDTADAEAYWSLVLCRYGIEYVEDPKTHKRVPTVNRAQFTSIFDDDNYKSALQYADGYQRELYESEAKEINDIQKGILAISQKEEPFDVFICYKETDTNGRRTQDSVLANDLYHQLIQEGYKVFFSRITLEDKLGTAYEPYIFAALNSARVMVVLGTKTEYFNAVWVKNEWSRYLALVKQSHGKKVLIPAYRDMDPYDLPEEFSHLQAQDMSKLGFMQDLLRGIKKIVQTEEAKVTIKETIVTGGNSSVQPLLERAFMSLEDGEWDKADGFCEQALNLDPKNPKAYLGKLMAECKVRHQDDLANLEQPFEDNGNYQKAVRFGDAQMASKLKEYNTHIVERIEIARLTEIYNNALNEMNHATGNSDQKYRAYSSAASTFQSISGFKDADELAEECLQKAEASRKDSVYILGRAQMNEIRRISVSDYSSMIQAYQKAIKTFESISGWKDSNEQISACQRGIEQVKARQESDRLEREREEEKRRIAAAKAAKKRKKIKILVSIAVAVVLIAVVAVYVFVTVILPKQKYDAAMAHFNAGEYEEALDGFEKVENYKDSDELAEQCRTAIAIEEKYQKAAELYASGDYKAALEAFMALESYKDSAEQIEKCNAAIMEDEYNAAVGMYDSGKHEEALAAFEAMGGYKDSVEQIEKCRAAIKEDEYITAVGLYDSGKYEEAITAFKAMDGYKDSAEQITKCETAINDVPYQNAVALVNSRKYYDAYWAFYAIQDYKDSAEQLDKTKKMLLNNAQIGDTVVFGHYAYKKYNEWVVLDKQGSKLFLISRIGIGESKQYHNKRGPVTWEKSTLRAWLNGEYISKAFSSEEQGMIISTKNKNPNNPTNGTPGGKDTVDKVFLLSIDEVFKYFPSAQSRYFSNWWWLRSPGHGTSLAAGVSVDGVVDDWGDYVDSGLVSSDYDARWASAVRPALWITIGS